MLPRGHGEDVIEFLERPLLRLGHEEEDQHESGDVEAGVEAKGARDREGADDTREGD